MAVLAKTVKVTSVALAVTSPTRGGTEFTKLNIFNRMAPEGLDWVRPLPDLWVRTDGTAAVAGADECILCAANNSVEIPWVATVSIITSWGSTKVNIVGVP